MKKFKNRYLILAMFIFVLMIVPYFQNFGLGGRVKFFFAVTTFNNIYLPFFAIGMIEGILIFLSVRKFIIWAKQKEIEKLDLS